MYEDVIEYWHTAVYYFMLYILSFIGRKPWAPWEMTHLWLACLSFSHCFMTTSNNCLPKSQTLPLTPSVKGLLCHLLVQSVRKMLYCIGNSDSLQLSGCNKTHMHFASFIITEYLIMIIYQKELTFFCKMSFCHRSLKVSTLLFWEFMNYR